MLLGTTANKDTFPGTESLVIQLILQKRYAQAYELLIAQQSTQTAALYNMALCLHWSGNYQEALSRLERIQLAPLVGNSNKLDSNSEYTKINSKQNQTDDYLHAISEIYIKSFPVAAGDAVIRLKTDCWLQLGNYAKVIAVATPVAYKGYHDIENALKLASTANDQRI
jgi:tetratricopeptide (TPR) repeat protein